MVIVDDELVVDVLVLDQVDALVPKLVRLLGLVEVAAVFEGCLMRLVHVGEELLLMVLIVLIPLVLVGRVRYFVVHVGLAFFQEFVYLFFYAVVLMFSLPLAFALDFTSVEVSLVPAHVLALIRFHVGRLQRLLALELKLTPGIVVLRLLLRDLVSILDGLVSSWRLILVEIVLLLVEVVVACVLVRLILRVALFALFVVSR